jgi:hypothetical protein
MVTSCPVSVKMRGGTGAFSAKTKLWKPLSFGEASAVKVSHHQLISIEILMKCRQYILILFFTGNSLQDFAEAPLTSRSSSPEHDDIPRYKPNMPSELLSSTSDEDVSSTEGEENDNSDHDVDCGTDEEEDNDEDEDEPPSKPVPKRKRT